ncbi:MAG TPA: hypothetical protein VFM14_07955 [Gemmatimonadales bacterium]|nr:hypothetical protein [Gemmatimonadales bacterium]
MSMTLTVRSESRRSATVGDVLTPLHERWLAAVEAAVQPALLGTSTIWDRWAATRYLEERFATRLELELSLVRLTDVSTRDRERIEADYTRIEQLRGAIEAVASRHHTGGLIMSLLQELLSSLTGWVIDVEQATARIPLAALPGEAVRLLTELEADPLETTGQQ